MNGPRPQFRERPIRSFVLRTGRMTPSQAAALESHWQEYGLDLNSGRLDFDVLFDRTAPRVLEIGFGMGDSLLEMCRQQPESDFIGVEVHPPGVGRLLNRAAAAGVRNLRVYMADARDVLDECIADATLDRIQIFFPDPWPKKRHHKRRLVQTPLLELCARKLKVDGLLHLATDWEPYAEWMREQADPVASLQAVAQGTPLWQSAARPRTKFETRGEDLGHKVEDLLYRRTVVDPTTDEESSHE